MSEQTDESRENESARSGFRRYKGIFLIILLSILVFLFLWEFDSVVGVVNRYLGYISPVLYGIFIAYLLNPVVVFFSGLFEKRFSASKREKTRLKAKKLAKSWSITVAMSIGILFIVVLCLLIIPSLLESVIDLAKQLPPLLEQLVEEIDGLTSGDKEWAGNLQTFVDSATQAVKDWINTNLLPTAQSALTYITSSVASVVMFLYNFLVGIIVAVYALIEKKNFTCMAKKLAYVLLKPKNANRLIDTARHGNEIFGGFITGKIIDSLIVGVICFIFTLCAGTPYPLLVSTIIGITNIIPFFGPFIGGIPTTFFVLMIDPVKGVIFGIFIIVLQQIDGNIIGAKILGNTTGISEFWVTFSLLLFGGMFGFIGMIIGVPLFAVIYYFLSVLVNERAERKAISTDDSFYYDVDRYDEQTGGFVMFTDETRHRQKKRVGKSSGRWDKMLAKLKKKSKDKDKKDE